MTTGGGEGAGGRGTESLSYGAAMVVTATGISGTTAGEPFPRTTTTVSINENGQDLGLNSAGGHSTFPLTGGDPEVDEMAVEAAADEHEKVRKRSVEQPARHDR